MVKEKIKLPDLDLNKIIDKARSKFSGKEKGMGLQMSLGTEIFRPNKDSDFVLYDDSHWLTLTGIKGVPFGKVVQIAGRPDSGKSSHAMAVMKRAQKQDVYVILWDAENKFSPTRFDKHFGGESSKLLMVTCKTIREGADMVKAYVEAIMSENPEAHILIVWDSVGGTLSRSEMEKDAREGHQMAEAAKENGMAVRGFVLLMEQFKNKETNEERIAVLLINQVYSNIGSPGQKESGGQKVEFHSSIILQLTRKKDLVKVSKGVKLKTGIVTRAKVKKNHLFDGENSVAEMDLVVTAGGIRLLTEVKTKGDSWDNLGDDDGELEEASDE